MSIKKIVTTLLIVNALQFIIGLVIWIMVGNAVLSEVSFYVYLSVGLMLLSSSITIFGLYFASRYKNESMEESIRNLEDLNTRLREQRHDYLNHFQVIYGLMELEEYEEAKKYLDPVFKDIQKVGQALKTAQPAVNALLRAKMEVAEQKGIDLYLLVLSDLKNIPMEAWNLCKVLANIIDNGITALLDKETDRIMRIEIGEDKEQYTFMICNNGPAIPENKLEFIFKQGYSTKTGEGHGMGLYIASQIVAEVEGTLKGSSTPEKTCFYIEIPKRAR